MQVHPGRRKPIRIIRGRTTGKRIRWWADPRKKGRSKDLEPIRKKRNQEERIQSAKEPRGWANLEGKDWGGIDRRKSLEEKVGFGG